MALKDSIALSGVLKMNLPPSSQSFPVTKFTMCTPSLTLELREFY